MAQVSLSTRIEIDTYQMLQKVTTEKEVSIAKFVDEAIKEKVEKEGSK